MYTKSKLPDIIASLKKAAQDPDDREIIKDRLQGIDDRAYMRAAEVAYRGNSGIESCERNQTTYSRLHELKTYL